MRYTKTWCENGHKETLVSLPRKRESKTCLRCTTEGKRGIPLRITEFRAPNYSRTDK